MKTLSPEEIECLLGMRTCGLHPLEILGYDYTKAGMRQFRAERPDFLPQVVSYIQNALGQHGTFPKHVNPNSPGEETFIQSDGGVFHVSRTIEIGISQLARISTGPLPGLEAIETYIRLVANPDYIGGFN